MLETKDLPSALNRFFLRSQHKDLWTFLVDSDLWMASPPFLFYILSPIYIYNSPIYNQSNKIRNNHEKNNNKNLKRYRKFEDDYQSTCPNRHLQNTISNNYSINILLKCTWEKIKYTWKVHQNRPHIFGCKTSQHISKTQVI